MADKPRPAVLKGATDRGGGWKVVGHARAKVAFRQTIDPRVATGIVLGRAAIMKINAVEGVTMSEAAAMRTADFDARGLSPDERRREIIEAYRR